MLSRRSVNAYRLMSEIHAVFGDAYAPSTGTIYPAMSALRKERLIDGEGDGARRTYRVTAQGRRALAERQADLARLEARTGARLIPDDSLDTLIESFVARVRQLAPRLACTDLEATLERTTGELRRLSEKEARSSRAHIVAVRSVMGWLVAHPVLWRSWPMAW